MEADVGNDVVTSLRSDLAGLQYKREKLISEVSMISINFKILFKLLGSINVIILCSNDRNNHLKTCILAEQ